MIDNFCKQILRKENLKKNFEDIIKQAKILEAARISAKKESRIKISDIK